MNPEHASQLALVRALRELGATHVRVGDIECRFDLVLKPLPVDDALMGESAEDRVMRKLRSMEEELGISRT